ncbi:MAG: GNAT family N-acetyltransferase [Rhodothermales bacterium]|nr:GNAT family N-acetyltransferase [Rhodothermales bacterium]MBO6778520.1 GNAT family N-acetyltransferase [Rhodothermales bacterium]
MIRALHEDDASACIRLLADTGQDVAPHGLRRFLAQRPRLSFVAESSGDVVGCVLASFNGLTAFLQHLAVSQPGEGLGRSLIAAVEEAAHAAGASEIMLLSTESASVFYTTLGYELSPAHVARKRLPPVADLPAESFSHADVVAVLSATPGTLRSMLAGLPDDWLHAVPAGESWSPYETVGHLAHGEVTDWMTRVRHILEHGDSRPFVPFDRAGRGSEGSSLEDLLQEFEQLRRSNLRDLERLALGDSDMQRPGLHPALGSVTMGQLLSTWAVHDLSHIAQISRVLAARYRVAVGPWRSYLAILDR